MLGAAGRAAQDSASASCGTRWRACPPDSIRPVRVRRGLTLEEVDQGRGVEARAARASSSRSSPSASIPTSTLRRPPPRLRARGQRRADRSRGGYRRGDMIGQTGLERLLDEHLRGRDGGERIEVDALGRPMQVMRREEPDPGAQVITTVDRRIQEAAERAHGRARGRGGGHGSAQRRRARAGLAARPSRSTASPGPSIGTTWLALVQDPTTSAPEPGAAEPVRAGLASSRSSWRPPGCRKARSRPWTACTATASSTWAAGPSRTGRRAGTATWTCAGPSSQSCNIFFYQVGLKVGPGGHRALRRRPSAWARRRASTSAARSPGSCPHAGPARRAAGRGWQAGRHREHVDRPGRSSW